MAQITFNPNTQAKAEDVNANFTELFNSNLGYAQVTASQASITSLVDLTNLTVTVTVPTGGRKVKITGWCGQISSSVDSDRVAFSIKEGATVLATSYGKAHVSTDGWGGANVMAVVTPSSGSHTYKLTAQRDVGSGNVTFYADATNPMFILVELI